MREEIGERGSGTHSERILAIFHGFEGILTVGAKEIINNPSDPSSQTFKKPKNRPKRISLEDAPFFYLLPYLHGIFGILFWNSWLFFRGFFRGTFKDYFPTRTPVSFSRLTFPS